MKLEDAKVEGDPEMRLVDVDELKKQMCDECFGGHCGNRCYEWDLMSNAPTVDAVPVVRCKDCVYCKRFNDVWYLPKRDELLCTLYVETYHTTENDFCSRGERRKDDAVRTV